MLLKNIFKRKKKVNYNKLPIGVDTMIELIEYLNKQKIKFKLVANSLNEWKLQVGTIKQTKIEKEIQDNEQDN